jgi:hypothetical protein
VAGLFARVAGFFAFTGAAARAVDFFAFAGDLREELLAMSPP